MIPPKRKTKPPAKAKPSRFDSLVARYYPAVYSFACRLTDNPRQAVALTRNAFKSAQNQLQTRGEEDALATILMSAVIRAGVATARVKLVVEPTRRSMKTFCFFESWQERSTAGSGYRSGSRLQKGVERDFQLVIDASGD